MDDGEFRILSGAPSDIQMKLNQWRHQFFIEILSMTSSETNLVVLFRRVKR